MLGSRCTVDSLFSKEEKGWGGIAGICPSGCFRALFPNRGENGCPVDEVEGIVEVDLKHPFVLLVDGIIVKDGAGCMYDGLGAPAYAHAEL